MIYAGGNQQLADKTLPFVIGNTTFVENMGNAIFF
jgi:hypothetical protein